MSPPSSSCASCARREEAMNEARVGRGMSPVPREVLFYLVPHSLDSGPFLRGHRSVIVLVSQPVKERQHTHQARWEYAVVVGPLTHRAPPNLPALTTRHT